MSELTDEKLKLVVLAATAMRLTGKIPHDATLSPKRLARISQEIGCPVSEATIRRVETRAIERAKLNAPKVARLALEAYLSRKPQS